MKIYKIDNTHKKQIYHLIKRNLKKSIIFTLSKKFITDVFLKQICNEQKFFSIQCKKKNNSVGFIIVKKKYVNFSIFFYITTFFYALNCFIKKDKLIFFKLFSAFFKKRKVNKSSKMFINDSAEIIYICVEKKYRKKRIGKKLISYSTKYLKSDHKYLITSSENSPKVINFYLKNKFKKIGIETRYKKKNILMIRKL